MAKYQVSFVVAEGMLETVLGLLVRDHRIASVNVAPYIREVAGTALPAPGKTARTRTPRPSRVAEAILAYAKTANGVVTMTDLGGALEKAGFAASSASPAISDLIRKGVFARGEKGTYKLTGAAL